MAVKFHKKEMRLEKISQFVTRKVFDGKILVF